MKLNLSLNQRFMSLLALFALITAGVLYVLINKQNEGINFAAQELKGNVYQRPIEKIFKAVANHRILAQRALHGDAPSMEMLSEVQSQVSAGFAEWAEIDQKVGSDLQFTPEGLKARSREAADFKVIEKQWSEIKTKLTSLKPEESNARHEEVITSLRLAVTHLGDTSNLILDPDLDSYYLMDLTLLAVPQSQDRIQQSIIELEPMVRSQRISTEDRIRASVLSAMMRESDLERIKADYQTVLNEDGNFNGKLASLVSVMGPAHEKFVTAYSEWIAQADLIAQGKVPELQKFLQASEHAVTASFDYWNVATDELDQLLERRNELAVQHRLEVIIFSVAGMLLVCGFAFFFMRNLNRSLRRIVDMLNKTSVQVATASTQSAASATELSEASTEQAASLQETMASIEQISAMVSQNADSASKTKEAVDANQVVAQQGSDSVSEMLLAINEIKKTNEEILDQMESGNKQFGEIVKIISEIGEKTTVINEIVFQTKLLSFNASVEAARAGEHGKGFAVVAEEVGNLAQMSGNAAKEITDMLSHSIKKVNEIVEQTRNRVDRLVEIGKDKIAMGQSTAQKCREALEKITVNAQGVAAMINEINHASKEQAQGVQEINKAISQLDQVTQQNSSVAQQSSSQAENLSQESRVLASAVENLVQFIEGQHQPAPVSSSAMPVAQVLTLPTQPKPAKTSGMAPQKAVGASETPSADHDEFQSF